MSPLKSMIMIWALNLLSEIIKTADLIYNSWPNINCNSCMECNLEENVPLEIVFTDQITRDKPGAGSAHQDKFIFYETWPCLCVSLHWRHNQHISDIAHCSFKNQIVSICWQTNLSIWLSIDNDSHKLADWQQQQHSQIGSQQQLQGCGQKGSFKLCHHNYCQNAKPKFAATKSFFFLVRSSLTRDTESLSTQNWNI